MSKADLWPYGLDGGGDSVNVYMLLEKRNYQPHFHQDQQWKAHTGNSQSSIKCSYTRQFRVKARNPFR